MRKGLNIALDVDGVLANFSQGAINRAKQMGLGPHFPNHYTEVKNWGMSEKFSEVMRDAWTDEEFWLSLKPLPNSRLSFTPLVYITSRQVPSSVTEKWLSNNGFPEAEVITVDRPEKKLMYLKQLKAKVLVDDLYSTVRQCREAGINALLYHAPYQVGHELECLDLPVIKNLEEVWDYL